MHTYLHKDRRMGEGIIDSQEKVGHVDNGRVQVQSMTTAVRYCNFFGMKYNYYTVLGLQNVGPIMTNVCILIKSMLSVSDFNI